MSKKIDLNHIHRTLKGSTLKTKKGLMNIPEMIRWFRGKIIEQNKKGKVDERLIKPYTDFYTKVSTSIKSDR